MARNSRGKSQRIDRSSNKTGRNSNRNNTGMQAMRAEVISQRADEYKQRAEESLNQAKKKFATAEKKVRGYINENPEKALLMAAGVGAAIGSLITAFFRDKARRY